MLGLLGPLATVAAPSGYVGVFVSGNNGDALEKHFLNGWQPWAFHSHPSNSILADLYPSVVAAPSGYIGAFFIGTNQSLYELATGGDGQWTWYSHGTPPSAGNANIEYSPSAVATSTGSASVFVVADLGQRLYERYFVAGSGWFWAEHGSPTVPNLVFTYGSSAVASPDGNYIGVFIPDCSGHVWELPYSNGWQPWVDHGLPTFCIAAASSPSAVVTQSGNVEVFVIGADGHLHELHQDGSQWSWIDHGVPSNTSLITPVKSNPSAVVAPSGYVGVFVFGADNQLYELGSTGGTNWTWYEHGLLPGADRPFYSPSTVAALSGYVGVFMVGSNYHLYERYFVAGSGWFWTDWGTPS